MYFLSVSFIKFDLNFMQGLRGTDVDQNEILPTTSGTEPNNEICPNTLRSF
jgi:hypothetical protein